MLAPEADVLEWSGALFNIEHQTFEIFTFRVEDVDRMVCRLAETVKNADVASHLRGGAEDSQSEGLLVHNL